MEWNYLTQTGKRYWQYLGISFVILFIYLAYSSFTTLNELAGKPYIVAQTLISVINFFITFHVIVRGMYKAKEGKIRTIKMQVLWLLLITTITTLSYMLLDLMFMVFAPYTLEQLLATLFKDIEQPSYPILIVLSFLSYWSVMVIWVLVYVIVVSGRNYKKLKEVIEKQELKILINQINPDFLYNTMDVIKKMIDVDAEQAADVVTQASELFRYNLTASNSNTGQIEQELASLTNYLGLLKLQGGAPDKIYINLEQQEHLVELPTMTLIFMASHILKNALYPHHALSMTGNIIDGSYQIVLLHSSAKKRKLDVEYFRNIQRRLAFIFNQNAQLISIKDKTSHKLILTVPIKVQETIHPQILPSVI